MTRNHIILVNGNVGTGKTTVSEYLEGCLGYDRFSKDDIRRKLEKRHYGSRDLEVLEELDKDVSSSLERGGGVIIDATYKTRNGRQHVYDSASAYGLPVVVVECICPEDIAKHRISQREVDGLHSPPNDTVVYDRIAHVWEDVSGDFRSGRNPHVSYLRYDSHFGETEMVILRHGSVDFVNYLAETTEKLSSMNWGLAMGFSLG